MVAGGESHVETSTKDLPRVDLGEEELMSRGPQPMTRHAEKSRLFGSLRYLEAQVLT